MAKALKSEGLLNAGTDAEDLARRAFMPLEGVNDEWIKGLTTRMLSEKFESLNLKLHIGKRRSYPGLVPFLHLDQIYFERPLYVESAELVRTRLATMASDHLPLLATFGWPVE